MKADHRAHANWSKYLLKAYALFLAIYTLPDAFSLFVGNDLDSSWVRAINYAVKHQLVFGSDFVFTYGPLGYLSTRFTQYVPDALLFCTDIFVCLCFYHIIFKFLSGHKGWILPVTMAVFYCKGCEYAEIFFLLFIVFSILILNSREPKVFELVSCAMCGTVVFFIKLNYGIFSIPVLLILCILLGIRNRRSFLVLASAMLVMLAAILGYVRIDLFHYARYGLSVVLGYPEAMAADTSAVHSYLAWAFVFLALYAGILVYYLIRRWRFRELTFAHWLGAVLLAVMCFLMFKNGFTSLHIKWFYYMLPVFSVFSLHVLGFGPYKMAKIISYSVVAITFLNVSLPRRNEGKGWLDAVVVAPLKGYFSSLFVKEVLLQDPGFRMPEEEVRLIGRSPVDIMPVDISLLLQHSMNYAPRPDIQTYQAYSPLLDSLNAYHFYKTGRPGFAIIGSWSIQDKYSQWEESLTKCMLRLNYDCINLFSLKIHPDSLNPTTSYLLLRSKLAVQKKPVFEEISGQTIHLDDTVHINFPDDQAIYMTADVAYTPGGKITNLLFQPPLFSVSFFFDSSCLNEAHYRATVPLLKEPELINKAVTGNRDLRNFMTGNLSQCRTIRAFAFHATGNSCRKEIRIRFYRFCNYGN